MGGQRRQIIERLEQIGLAVSVGPYEHGRTRSEVDGEVVPGSEIV